MPYTSDPSYWSLSSPFPRSTIQRWYDSFMGELESGFNLLAQSDSDKCYFCEKKIKNIEHKTIKIKEDIIHVCNNCKYLYRTINNENKSKNLKTIRGIISFLEVYGD